MFEHGGRAATVADALGDAADRLARSGIAEPRREARALWAAVAGDGSTPGDAWVAGDRAPAPGVAERFRRVVERRARGVPFAYAAGWTDFRTLRLEIDRRALIPRPETEGLVDLVLRAVKGGVVADIGTGCGCIALSLAVEGHFDRVIAVERSPRAAALARANVARVRPPVPVDVREGDLLAPLAAQRVRVIVSNPPYLTQAEYDELDPAVRLEPREALVSGTDGLEATTALLAGAGAFLEPGGVIALEVDERRAGAVGALARRLGWSRVIVHDDLFGRPRFLLARRLEDA